MPKTARELMKVACAIFEGASTETALQLLQDFRKSNPNEFEEAFEVLKTNTKKLLSVLDYCSYDHSSLNTGFVYTPFTGYSVAMSGQKYVLSLKDTAVGEIYEDPKSISYKHDLYTYCKGETNVNLFENWKCVHYESRTSVDLYSKDLALYTLEFINQQFFEKQQRA